MLSTSQKIILFWVLFYTIPFFSNAQNTENSTCFTCGSTSKEIQTFITFSNEILDWLWGNTTLVANWTKYQVFWPRQWWVYNWIMTSYNPSSILWNIVAGTLKNFDKRQSYIKTTADLLSMYSIDILVDWWMWFLVSAQPRPIIRDYQLLLDIDTIVWDKIYDIGIAWWYNRLLTAEQISTIKNIFDNNTGPWKIFEQKINISNNLSSTDILHAILRLNSRYKKWLTLWSKKFDTTIKLWSNKDLIINQSHLDNLVNSYSCVRIGKASKSCSSSFKIFKENIKNISNSFKEKWPKQSRTKIETASKRLATRALQIIGQTDNEFYKKNSEDYITREQEILSSQPWGQILEKRSWFWIITWAISSNISRTISSDRSRVITSRNNAKNIYTELTQSLFTKQHTPPNITTNSNYPPSPQEIMISYELESIVQEHAKIKENNLKTSTTDSQYIIAQTFRHIRIINNTLQDKIKEDIARTCELQCSNLWWICR